MKNQGFRDGKAGRKQIYHLDSGLSEKEYELADIYVFWYGVGKLEREGKI